MTEYYYVLAAKDILCFVLFGSINIYGIWARIAEKCNYVNKIVFVFSENFSEG
jgi:hypothetical protein